MNDKVETEAADDWAAALAEQASSTQAATEQPNAEAAALARRAPAATRASTKTRPANI
jgi:hypothetical protein